MNDITRKELELDGMSATFKELKDEILLLKKVKSEYSQAAIILLRNVFSNRLQKIRADNAVKYISKNNVSICGAKKTGIYCVGCGYKQNCKLYQIN